jgi:cytidine deaminase
VPDRLVELARGARVRAYAPYSEFKVGAAALFEGGRIFTGCNVENASRGATRCAEQVAILSGVAAGCHRLEAVAVVTEGDTPAWPCGICRQVIYEFGPEATVIAATVDGAVEEACIRELLPRPFGPEALE